MMWDWLYRGEVIVWRMTMYEMSKDELQDL